MVKYIAYQGKEYPIRVSYYALKMLKEELGRSLNVNDDGTDYQAYEILLYYALKKGHQKVHFGEPFPFVKGEPDNPMDVENVMDEVYFKFIGLVPQFFSDTMLEEEEEKMLAKSKEKKNEKK